MSDYDILPKSLPDTATEATEVFDLALPDGYFGSAEKNGDAQLVADIYEMFFDGLQENSAPPPPLIKNNHPFYENKSIGLRAFIAEALDKKLPQLIEYRQKGYNLVGLDRETLHTLQTTLQNQAPTLPSPLLKPAQRFTDILNTGIGSDGVPSPELLQALPVVNAVIQHLLAALEDLGTTRKVSTLNWEEESEQTAREHRKALVSQAARKLLPDDHPAAEQQATHQWLDSLLFSQSNALSAEYKKFSLLKASLMAESRITRQRLAAHLDTRAQTLLEGAREARSAALDMLLAESSPGQMSPEQLMHWSQGYQLYARYLQAIDDEPAGQAIAGNPLIAAVRASARQGGTLRARLAGAIVPLADALGAVAVWLLQEKKRTEPAPAEPQPAQRNEAGLTGTIKKVIWDKGRKKGRAVRAASAWLAKSSGSKASRAAWKTKHTLQRTPSLPENTRQAISNTALLLLDEIQQAERRIKLLPGYAWVRQEAVQQLLLLGREIADPQELPLLDELVSERLDEESARWKHVADNAAGQINALLSPLTRLAETTGFNDFYFALSDTLRANPVPGSGEAIAGMDETVIRVTEQLAELGRQLNAAAVRLSGHGHEGGKELREKAGFWLMTLKTLKTQVKTQATHLTGHAPDNFSRSGMLARGIAEWAQKLKEECLADLSGDERADAEGLFDELLMELLGEHRSHFADRRDPQAESLLKSVSVALKHAARGTTIYPPTAEEILAGTRSLPADIRHWAEKKMLTGALSAAVSGGFKLLTGPISLPVRIVLRGAKTGWTLNKHLRAMNRVRLGEGPATGSARSRLINQELSKLAFRLTLSLSPAGGYGVAATLVGSQMVRGKKGYTKALAKKVVVDLPQEALWFGLAYGGYAGVNAVVRASAERAMQNAWEEARRSERERMNRLIQQLTMADILEQKSAFGLVESTDNTDTALTVETTDEAADVSTTVDRDASKDQPAATVAEEGKTPAAANTDQSTTNKRKMPLLPPSRVKRFTPGGDTTGTGISLNSTADTHDNKLFTSQVSDSLKAMVGKLATGQAFWHEDLKNGQEGSIYNIGSKYFICINEKYWPIYIKDNKRGVITANPYTRGSKIEIEVHLDKNTWIPTAAENIKDDYPTLPVDPDSTASEGDEALKQPNNSPKGHAQSPASTASSELYNLAKVWSVYSAFYYDNMVKSKEAQIYADSNTHKTYIYLYGFYWPIIITGNSTAVIEVSDNGNGKKELINIRKIDQRWELAPTFRTNQMPEKSGGNFSIESYIKVFFNTELSSDINPDNLQAGENGLLIDKTSGFNYLLVAGYYWPVTFTLMGEFDDKEVRRIYEWGGTERLNIYYNYALGAWIPVQTTDEADDTDTSTVKNTLSADLIAKMKEWDLSSYERPANSGPGLEGEVYQDAKGRYYIYLQNHYWNFSWIKRDVGGVEVTTNGGRKLIILRKYGNEWQYFDEETVKDDFNLSTLLNDINDAKLDKETQTALESLLWNSSFTSLDNFLHELQKRLDNAFYRLYEKPFSEELSNVIYLSNRVSSLQKSLAYYDPDEDNEENQYDWNESLLALYQEEFTSEEEESSYLYTARQARNAAEEAKKRVAQFSTANIDKQLREEFEALAKRKEDWVAWLTFPSHGGPLDKAVTFTQPILESLSIKIKAHEAKIEQLTALRKQVLDRKAEYQKIIDNYNKNYRLVNMAIDFAKKAIANKKKTTGINDTLKIAESVLIDLTLQKIDVRNSAAGTDTKFEADKLKILSISKTMIAQLIERHTLSQELIKTISNTSINFLSLKNSYKDIEWSNTQAERIYKANYPDDDNPEANQLLAPLIYWLLKNKNNLNLLKSMDIDEVVDIYYADVYSLNPLQQIKEMPEGYIPLSHLLGSEYFNTDSEYYQQFITYKEKYSSYEASENTKNLLLASDLSLSEITSKVKKRFYFNVLQSSDVRSKHDGAMLFIELQDGRWVFFSLFPDSLFSRVFSRQEMMGNIWLKTIANLSPEQTHYHGTESVFTESFFFKNFDPDNKNRKNSKYRTLEARKNKELKDFIDNTLYKGSDGITYNNPFKNLPYYGLTYDFSINSRQPQETLLETVNKAFHDVLNRSATNRKTVLYQTTIFNKIADILIPFYAEIRGSINDPEHKVDAASIMLDVVGVCFVASQAGTKATTLLKNAKGIGQIIGEGTKKGLVGRGLQKYVIKEMGKQGLINAARLSKISVNALLDLVLPFDVGSLLKKTTKKTNLFSGFESLVNSGMPASVKSRGINKKYINTEISIDDLTPTTEHGVTVYITKANGKGNGNYYIKSDNNIYQIRWDDHAYTWRTVDPKNPGRFSYGEPIVYEDGKWIINKNYGGLRGGSKTDPDIIMGEMPNREGLPAEKVTENLISTKDVDAQSLLNEIKQNRELNSAILSPSEKCESVIIPVAKLLEEKGFTDIRCRAMAFFVNGMDDRPGNHFLVIASKDNVDYAIDITAGQFYGQFEELSGPIIMPEAKWAQKYNNVTSERKLIIYADYPFRKTSDARSDFGPYSPYLGEGPNCRVPNAKVIKRPVWYYPKKTVDDLPPIAADKKKAGGAARINPVREAARRSRLTNQASGASWDHAVDLLENAELLSKGPATNLRTGLRQAASYQRETASSPGALDGLFSTTQVVNSHESLLRVKRGEIVMFMEVDPNLPGKGPRPVHAMVSLGNGRFAGINNSVLDSSFGNGKRILTAEQLGEFQNGAFKRRGNAQLPDLQIITGTPKGLQLKYPSLKSLAESASLSAADNADIATTTAEFLSKSGEIAGEQASALKNVLAPLLSDTSAGAASPSVTRLLTDAVSVNKQQLANLPKGQLVIFDKPSGLSSTRHVMYSLGNGEYFIVNPRQLDAGLPANKAIVRAEQLSEEIFKNRKVYTGKISLTNLRMRSLLGQDASFVVSGSKVTVTAHGAASSVNTMDAAELADVIRGLGLREGSKVDWSKIKEIELKSCFGAFGSLPIGKVLANILGKKVTAYPFYFSEKMRDTRNIFTRARTYLPGDLATLDLEKLTRQQSRNHDLWVKLLRLSRKEAARQGRHGAGTLDNTLEDIAKLARGDTTVDQFLKDYPDYKTGLSVTERELNALVSENIPDDDTFAMRCWDVLMLSTFTRTLMDEYLEG